MADAKISQLSQTVTLAPSALFPLAQSGQTEAVAFSNLVAATYPYFSAAAPLVFNNTTGAFSIPQANGSTNGFLASTDWTNFNNTYAHAITALTGDGTATGPGSVNFTLATVNSNVGSFGSSTAIPTVTVNAKGLITAISTNAVIAPAGTLTGSTLASNVTGSSLTSVGILTSGIWNATPITGTYIATNTVTNSNLAQMSANTVKANTSNVTANASDVALGTVTESTSAVLTLTGWSDATIGSPTIQVKQSGASQSGYLSSTDWNTFNNKQPAGSYITALIGDGTASGPGSAAFTLATVNSNVGSFGSSTAIPSFTVNAKGLITAASTSAVIAPAGTLTGNTLASNVITSSLTSVGTITTGTWNGTEIAVAYGGTGNNSALNQYGVVYALSSSQMSTTSAGTAGYPLVANSGVGPSFQQLSLTSGVTGILPLANGGTNSNNGSITGSSALNFTAGGTNQNVTLTPSGTGFISLNGNVQYQDAVYFDIYLDTTTTGSNASISATNRYFYEFNNPGLLSVNFISGGTPGQVLILKNGSGSTITLVYNVTLNGGIITPTAANIPLYNSATVSLYYDPVHGFWFFLDANYVDALLPAQGSSANQFLTTNGTSSSWSLVSLTSSVSGILPFANGGTNNSTSYTAGSIPFSNGTSLTQNNADFFWDNTNVALGVGTIPATTALIDVVNNSGSNKAVQLTTYGANAGFRSRYANGTLGSPTAAVSGNVLTFLGARGWQGSTGFATASTGAINMVAGETFTTVSNATYIQFEVTPTGSVTIGEAMRLNSTGNLLIGTTTDSGTQKLQVNGNSNVGTVTAGVWNGTAINLSTYASGTLQAAQFPALTGDITTTAGSLTTTLATVNSNVGTFASVTVNAKGLVTAAANLSGDATTSNSTITFATVNSNTGSFGSSTAIPSFTVNAKGLITAASTSAVIAPAGTLTGTTLASNVVTSSLTTVGTIGTGVWQGTAVATGFGGTGATSVSGARTNLGIGASSDFLTTGTTFTTPSTITSATQFKFTLVGGGGGGGGIATNATGVAGGGAGAVGIVFLTGLAPSTSYTIAIGAAGSAGTTTPSAGGSGGNTTLTVGATTYTAGGGGGGSDTAGVAGGAGGTCTNMTISMNGQPGGGGQTAPKLSGPGGSNQFGQGGIVGIAGVNSAGAAGTGYGAGGSGGYDNNAAVAGGAGTAGCILVEWWD